VIRVKKLFGMENGKLQTLSAKAGKSFFKRARLMGAVAGMTMMTKR